MDDQIEWDSLMEFLIAFFGTNWMINSSTVSENSYQEKMLKKAITYELVVEVSRKFPNSIELFSDYILLPIGKKEIEKKRGALCDTPEESIVIFSDLNSPFTYSRQLFLSANLHPKISPII